MKIKNILLLIIIIFILFLNLLYMSHHSANAADMILDKNAQFFQAYYTQGDTLGWDVELKGKIIGLGVDSNIDQTIEDKVQDNTSASVRLYNNLGIYIGDLLYIVDDNNLIVGKIKVTSVFRTDTFGYLVLGTGKLRLVSIGNRVVQRVDINAGKSINAFVYRGKGDISREEGKTGIAINYYKNALSVDKNDPEAHIALGYIYLNDDMLEYANIEFTQAEKNIRRLYDAEYRYSLYKGLSEVRFKQAYYVNINSAIRTKYIKEGIKYCINALDIYPDSKEVNYYLGIFYYRNSAPSDVLAKGHLLKVIALDENNVEAYLALADLYDRHDNKEKAVSYAEQALKLDPANDKAKYFIKKLK